MKTYNVAVVGVGGQGILTLGTIIGVASTIIGRDIAIAEVHGMSQRGGSVIVHIRIGDEPSPIIPIGSADHIIALELIEAARYLHYARKDAVLSVNDFLWPPPTSTSPSREVVIGAIKAKPVKLYIIDANKLSLEHTGSIISANVAMLGFAIGVDSVLAELLPIESVERALEEVFSGRVLDANRRLLRASYEEGLKQWKRS